MKKIRILAVVGFAAIALVVAIGAYAGGFKIFSNPTGHLRQGRTDIIPQATATPAESRRMPEHVQYNFVFHHLVKIGELPTVSHNYQQKSRLSDNQFSQLVELAREHERDVAEIDQQAKQIIAEFRIANPPGRLPVGAAPPATPQELVTLQNRRNDTSLHYRDRLRQRLGEGGFATFTSFLTTEFPPTTATTRDNTTSFPKPTIPEVRQ